MKKTRFNKFTSSELITISINLNDSNDFNLTELKKELQKEIDLRAEKKYKHEINCINESILKLEKKKKDLELYINNN